MSGEAVKLFGGVWMPAHETHMYEWMKKRNKVIDGKLTYQYHKLEAALPWVKKFECAVDVGAHVGFWSMHLAKKFNSLHAFEPVALHRECFSRNVTQPNVTLHPVALGNETGSVSIHTSVGSSGDSWVEGKGDIPLRRLDDLLGGTIDFMKIDCEGYELFVLQGAEELIRRSKPCIVVEQKHRPGQFAEKYGIEPRAALPYLEKMGAKLRKEWSGDFIYSWD